MKFKYLTRELELLRYMVQEYALRVYAFIGLVF